MNGEGTAEILFPGAYAVKHKVEEIRMSSRSGGVFTALSDHILEQGGIIFGCAVDENLEVIHKRAISKSERDEFRGSKYVQSNLRDTFTEVKNSLREGSRILYTGTPCQISALRRYLEKEDTAELLLVDIVCHGVPSPKVYRDYLSWMEKKKKGRVSRIDFRNKRKFGWAMQIETVTINGSDYDSSVYSNLFIRNNILRPCCYQCPFKSLIRPGDLTIADYWGVDKAIPGFDDNKGVSLVLANNKKGQEFFLSAADALELVACKVEDCLQPSLLSPVTVPESRKSFWEEYAKKPFPYIVKRYASDPWKVKLKMKLGNLL